jgi:hypothetical protein
MNEPITYTESDGRVTVEMSRENYEQLIHILGFSLGALKKGNEETFYRWIDFVNRLNRTNPHFQQYEIPEAYRPKEPPG